MLVVVLCVVWTVVPNVEELLDVPGLLELVEGAEVGDVAPVEGGAVLEVTGAVPFEDVVAVVAGILQSGACPTPVLGCFVEPGGMSNTWPINNLSQSSPGLSCCSDEN